jgi:hypothetical protein
MCLANAPRPKTGNPDPLSWLEIHLSLWREAADSVYLPNRAARVEARLTTSIRHLSTMERGT